jgi:hypothetical protein
MSTRLPTTASPSRGLNGTFQSESLASLLRCLPSGVARHIAGLRVCSCVVSIHGVDRLAGDPTVSPAIGFIVGPSAARAGPAAGQGGALAAGRVDIVTAIPAMG